MMFTQQELKQLAIADRLIDMRDRRDKRPVCDFWNPRKSAQLSDDDIQVGLRDGWLRVKAGIQFERTEK